MQPFRVALCQVRAFDLEDAASDLENVAHALDEAGAAGAQLVALPECSYPAYYVRDANPYARPGVPSFESARDLFAAKAKRYGYWLAAGIAVPHDGGTLTNSGLVFGPDGESRGRYDKSFLWHFDNNWFTLGRSFPVFDAGFCRFGILICADGRLPEIARSLAVNGAEVILDLTAWVSSGRSMSELSTTQCEYLMPTRAAENGVWVAAADKWGTEDGSIVYAGRSCVIDPTGATRVCAASDREAVVVFDVQPMAAEIVPRRPGLYGALTRPTADLPATAAEDRPLIPSSARGRVAVVPGAATLDAATIAARFAGLRAKGADLVVCGGTSGPEGWEVGLPLLESAVKQHGGALALAVATNGCMWRQSAVLVTPEHTYDHLATHGRGIELGELNAPVVPTPFGHVALVCGDEGLVPEVARCLALEGADILAWSAFEARPMIEQVTRTRADENKVYVASAWTGGAMVASPDGAIAVMSPAGSGAAMTTTANLALSRSKERAPGTNVIRDRIPEAYGALTR
ncbi:MAG: hypothetical protein HYX53_12405 [Chloroflexi bacterium]|nr:hypothetical protein [Chloroflexota bacterium]